ncbi:spore coat protein U domain-containing protein [Pseudomonas gingeri]|uniref:Spore coat protein U domain-containing protein n=1 Tax=Pseudomonas gingeri TaxID=117681 RepID=A0A7Y7X8M6_9PSED|nr:spore coat U domain-containing protein [Pseudomonas gingeri]NWA26024.1 spore coat protein U domain-containing protein [Pseudomonas gingeri]NWB95324.1 spore coat protein U domain-containing protein [Pseudomonas gingeri]NWD67539.1 spore coat protein U domain-containing protein [Pseudomonas gingeri]NWD74354.1 spore coat protein U domain-containing protein [Pseudomonas gingeri]
MSCVLLAVLLSGLASQAQALCTTAATTPVAFGPVSSILVRTTVQSSSTTNAGLRCTGSLLSLLTLNDHVYATITSATSGMVGPTGDIIGYNIYATNNTGAAYLITRGTPYDFTRNSILDLLGLFGGSTPKTVPIYMGTVIGSNVAAGIYSETLSIYWDWNYCSGIGLLGVCLGRDIGTGTQTITVNLTVVNDCAISAPNISFGGFPVISAFGPVNQTINISCTKGSLYTVGLDPGQNASGGRRRMISGSNYLSYDIFKSAGSTIWGSVATARRSSTDAEVNPGTGSGTGSQLFNYNAKVYPDQTTPPAGAYSDNVILDVGF